MESRIQLLILTALLSVGCTERTTQDFDLSNKTNARTSPEVEQIAREEAPVIDRSDDKTVRKETPSTELSESTTVTPASSIATGVSLKSALAALDKAGYTEESGWQWGSTNPDANTAWRVITDGVQIAINYSNKSQLITGVQMMYIPPDYTHRGNYQVVAADQVVFNSDGTYTVTFSKPQTKNSK
jgi:hypothetical protein